MKLLGLDLHKPTATELATVPFVAVCIWLLGFGVLRVAGWRGSWFECSLLFVAVTLGSLGLVCGMDVRRGFRYLVASVVLTLLVFGVGALVALHFGACTSC
jgi:hypothetical protein